MQPIERHTRAVLQFSGGKDSLACLHMLRPWWHRLTVLWVNTGAAFPETVDQMREVVEMVPHFVEVRSNQPMNTSIMGIPVDMPPQLSTRFGRACSPEQSGPLMQSYFDCCGSNLWIPMVAATRELGATLVIRGQRQADKRRAPVKSGEVHDGIEYWFPLENMTSAEVRLWLRANNVPLPAHYAYMDTSLDCWDCTAYLDENAGKMRYMREHHPVRFREVRSRLMAVQEAVNVERDHLARALEA